MAQLLFFHGTGTQSLDSETQAIGFLHAGMSSRPRLSGFQPKFVHWVSAVSDPSWTTPRVTRSLPPSYPRDFGALAVGDALSDGTEQWQELAQEINDAQAAGSDDIGGLIVGDVLTRVAKQHRVRIMNGLSAFLQSIVLYFTHRDAVRAAVADAILKVPDGEEIILLGHSLGGIVLVDAMSHRSMHGAIGGRPIKLLVTMGTQASWVYYLRGLASLTPENSPPAKPFSPWLNIYDENDLLSFYASEVFPEAENLVDVEIDQGEPFPAAHTNYLSFDGIYDLIEQRL